jgi:hypothetical protein
MFSKKREKYQVVKETMTSKKNQREEREREVGRGGDVELLLWGAAKSL